MQNITPIIIGGAVIVGVAVLGIAAYTIIKKSSAKSLFETISVGRCTISDIRNWVKKETEKEGVKKVLIAKHDVIGDELKNIVNLSGIPDTSLVMSSLTESGDVDSVCVVTYESLDDEVEKLLGSEGKVLIEA